MTREQVAMTAAARAMRRAGASADLLYRLALTQESAHKLSVLVPTYDRTGKAAIVYWLNHGISGLGVTRDDLRDVTTWGDLVGAVTRKLVAAPLIFSCTDAQEVHFYTDWGAGTCRIDGTPLEHVGG